MVRGGEADGPPYRVAIRLIGWVANNWDEVDGALLLRGVDLWSLPIDRALNVVYSLVYSGVTDEQDRYRLDTALNAPLPEEAAKAARSARDDFWAGADEDGKAFLAAMGQQNQLLSGKAPRR